MARKNDRAARYGAMPIEERNKLRERLRAAVRSVYDMQRLRIATANRGTERGEDAPKIELTPEDQEFADAQSAGLEKLEEAGFRRIDSIASQFPIYEWLLAHRGIGPAIAGIIISEFDPVRAPRPSNFWSYAGLGVVRDDSSMFRVAVERIDGVETRLVNRVHDGAESEYELRAPDVAPRPQRGQKLKYNAWLRAKMIAVLGGCLIKARNSTYTEIRENRLRFRRSQRILCMLCNGTGLASEPKIGQSGRVNKAPGELKPCWNCVANVEDEKVAKTLKASGVTPTSADLLYPNRDLTPQAAPWGRGPAHRQADATRYMVKMFLLALWREWRTLEGLPVVGSYHEERLGHVHGGDRRSDKTPG